MRRQDQIALVIEWDEGVWRPSVVGPFSSAKAAQEWATVNVPNGAWELRAMAYPYKRRVLRTEARR